MEQIRLLEGFEFWKILVCFLGATLGAFYFYYKSLDYSKLEQWVLSSLRFIAFFILLFLLLGPEVIMVTNEYSSPIIALIVDDSESIAYGGKQGKVMKRVNDNFKSYSDLGYDVHLHGLSRTYETPDSILFNSEETDLKKTLKSLDDFYYGLDLAKVVLYSDGIENKGGSVLTSRYKFKLDVVAVGDTTERMDVKVLRIENNENVYKGNAFLARAIIETVGVPSNQRVQISLYKGKEKLKDTVVVAKQKKLQINFKDTPLKEGIFEYRIVIKPLTGEVLLLNNSKSFFIEVMKGRDRVLLVYNAPHPDVKALREVFRGRKNFDLDVVSAKKSKEIVIKKYQLVIFHGLPTFTNQINRLITETKLQNVPSIYWVTDQTYLPLFNASSNVLSIKRNGDDNHVGVYSKDGFGYFQVSSDFKSLLLDFPPIGTPYGDYGIKSGTILLLGQQIGELKTEYPLLAMKYGEKKEGVFIGDGFWKWRLRLLMQEDKVKPFDDYFFNYFQLLASNRSFDRLRAFSEKKEYGVNEKVIFKGFTYNELYKEIYGEKIKLTITNQDGEKQLFSFVSSQGMKSFVLPFQKEGIYSYNCESTLNDKKFVTQGKFIVRKLNLEQVDLQADYDKLRSLAKRQNGDFRSLSEKINDNQQATKVIHSSSEDKELIEYKWLFYIFCFVISVEWFLRKYFGSL